VRSSRSGKDDGDAGDGVDVGQRSAQSTVARRALVASAITTLIGGCSASIAGVPVASFDPKPVASASDVLPDTGAYPTVPGPPAGRAGSEEYGRHLEGQRMANYVVVPSEVDPTLTIAIPQNTFTVTSPDGLPDPLDADDAKDFVVGYSTARSSLGHDVLINMVVRFTNPATAADAAEDMAALYASDSGSPATGNVSIPRHPGTRAFMSPDGGAAELHTASAHGPYVLIQFVQSNDGDGAATALVARTLDLQEPLIDRFVADDPTHLADLPADTTGLLSRTLRKDPRYSPYPGVWVLGPRAALHGQDNPVKAAAAFADAGVQAVSTGKSTVYQTADAHGAQRLADGLIAEGLADGYEPALAIGGVPTARCLYDGRDGDADDSPRQFYCVGTADRYAFEVYSDQGSDAGQEMAAQYLLLTARGAL
jgi:hypothetical protein